MQGINLSYARYMFYKSLGININMNNYRKLFVGQVEFKNRYGKNNKQLVDLYKYDIGKFGNNAKIRNI